MPKYRVPVSWQVSGFLDVEADDADDAIEKAIIDGTTTTAIDVEYIPGSWRATEDSDEVQLLEDDE